MNESFRKERWSNFDLQPRKLLFLKSGWSIPHLEADEKDGRNHWGFCRKNMQQKCLVCTCLQIAFWDSWWVHAIFQTSVCMWFKQGFFCHRLFGKHDWFFRTKLGWRNGGILFWSWSSFHSRVRWFSWQGPVLRGIICVWVWTWGTIEWSRSWRKLWGDQCRGFHSSDADTARMFYHNFRHVCSFIWMPPWEASWSPEDPSEVLWMFLRKWFQTFATHYWSILGFSWFLTSVTILWGI